MQVCSMQPFISEKQTTAKPQKITPPKQQANLNVLLKGMNNLTFIKYLIYRSRLL